MTPYLENKEELPSSRRCRSPLKPQRWGLSNVSLLLPLPAQTQVRETQQMCGAWLDFVSWGQEASSHLPRWPWRRLGKGTPCGQLQAPTLRVNQARDKIGGGREEGRERVRKREGEFVNPSITKVACQYCTCLKGKNGEFLSSNILSNLGTAATKVALMLISHLL